MEFSLDRLWDLCVEHFGVLPSFLLVLALAGWYILHLHARLKLQRERKEFSDERRLELEKEMNRLLAPHRTEGRSPAPTINHDNIRPSILLVEDEKALHYFKSGIEEELPGVLVRLANNGAEALAEVIKHPPDLIVTDIVMPVMNGYEFLSKLAGFYPDIPVLAISAYAGNLRRIKQEVEMRSLRIAFLKKPFMFSELLQAIKSLTDCRLQTVRDGQKAA